MSKFDQSSVGLHVGYRDPATGDVIFRINTDGTVNCQSVTFADGSKQTTASSSVGLIGSIAQFNPAADGVTDDSAAFTACAAANGEVWLSPGKSYFIGTNLTLSVPVHFAGGSQVIVGSGFTATFNGAVYASEKQQVFVVSAPIGWNQTGYDTLHRANENPISDGGLWTKPTSVFGVASANFDAGQVLSNAFQGVTLDRWAAVYWNPQGAIADQWASVEVNATPPSQSQYAVLVRGSLTVSTHYYLIVNGSSVVLGKSIAGSNTTLQSTTTSLSPGDVITLRVKGTTLTAYKNFTQLTTATDSAIATGYPGMAVMGHTSLSNAVVNAFITGTPVDPITGGTVVIGQNTPEVYPEWFGAKGDFNQTTMAGTDDTGAIQSAITAISGGGLGSGTLSGGSTATTTVPQYNGVLKLAAKTYLTTGALQLSASNVVISGISPGSSILACNHPTADVLRVWGTNNTSTTLIQGVILKNFGLMRIVPFVSSVSTQTLYSKFTQLTYYENLYAWNSLYCFRFDSIVTHTDLHKCWALTSNMSPAGCAGYGVFSSMTSSRWSDCIADGFGAQFTYGFFANAGGADFFCTGFETAAVTTGMQLNGGWSDTIIIRPIFESATGGGIVVPSSTSNILQIFGGYWNNSPLVVGSGATGVLMYGGQFTGGNASGMIQISGTNCVVSGCLVRKSTASAQPGIVLNGATGCTIVGNSVAGAAVGTPLSTGISLVSSTKNSIVGNNIDGFGTTGLSYDAASNNNSSTGNIVDTTNITTGKSDSGTGNTAGL